MFEGDEVETSDVTNKTIRKIKYYNKKQNTFEEKLYEIQHVLDFDPTRKIMSVLIKNCQESEYILYCKGADNSIMKVSSCGSAYKYARSLKSFSENGWRTLLLAYKVLTEEEFNEYNQLINEANSDILNREMKLAKAYDVIESNLKLVGVTAVEDKLQEDVENTLYCLRQAGIKIWVLTGDKLETAVNISNSCKHFSAQMKNFLMSNMSSQKEIENCLEIYLKK